MTPFRNWLGEIHRHGLWQALGVYLAGGWVTLQVVDIVVDSLDLPGWITVGAILLILAGLPVVLVTAYFQGIQVAGEMDPKGESNEEAHQESPESPASKLEDPEGRIGRGLFTWRNAVGAGVLAFAAWGVVAAAWVVFARGDVGENSAGPGELNQSLVAVLPFRVSGTGNLDFLSEGMVDLLAAKLTGEGGPRAADPRTIMSQWTRMAGGGARQLLRADAMRLARSIGAGRALIGGVVGMPSGLVINASLFDVGEGVQIAQASVQGSMEDLTAVVDQLTVQLLALEAGEEDQRLGALASTSLQALRAYLDGKVAYRRGNYTEADGHFQRAVEEDSTFALAALGWVSSAWWRPGYDRFNEARNVAWRLRDRLSPRDRALLDAWTGPRYPLASGWAEHLVRWELAIAAAPERPESWYESADIYFHYGPLLGVRDWQEQAEARMQRSSELDPTFAAPLGHLLELASIRGDEEAVRHYGEAYSAVDSAGDTSWFIRWRAASVLEDEAGLERVLESFPDLNGSSLSRIVGLAQLYDSTLVAAHRAASVLTQRVGTLPERWEWWLGLHSFALNRGRPVEALGFIQEWAEVGGSPRESLRIKVLDGLYWDGDPEAAQEAADRLIAMVDTISAPENELTEAQFADICVAEQWLLEKGDTSSALSSLARFRALADQTRLESLPLREAVCGATIEALLAMAQELATAGEAVERLNRLLLLVPNVETGDDPSLVGPFIVAQWRESQGDLEGALAAMRRWHNHWFTGVRYLST